MAQKFPQIEEKKYYPKIKKTNKKHNVPLKKPKNIRPPLG